MKRKHPQLCLALSFALLSRLAVADPAPADRATARTLAQEGADALEAKKYSVSLDRFSRAESLVHAPTLLLGIAHAQLGLGKLVEAQENYNRIIREGVAPGTPKAWAKALADATKEVDSLGPRIPWITITVNGPTTPDVVIDATPVPAASLGVRRAVNPGEHKIKATAEGFYPATRTITLVEGQTAAVTLQLEAAPPSPPSAIAVTTAPPATPGQPDAPKSTSGGRKTAAIIAYSIGGAGLVTGAIGGALAIQKHRTLARECTNRICDSATEQTKLDQYHLVANVSNVGFIVAGVGAVTGTILLLTLPRSASVQTGGTGTGTDTELSAFVGWGSAGVKGTW